LVEGLDPRKGGDAMTRKHQLRDARKRFDRDRGRTEIDERHHQFPTKITVDRPWRVDDGDPPFGGQPRPRPYLPFPSHWNGHCEAGGKEATFEGLEYDALWNGGLQIHPGSVLTVITRERNFDRTHTADPDFQPVLLPLVLAMSHHSFCTYTK